MAKGTLPLELTLSSPFLILLVIGFLCPEALGGGCDLQYLKTPPLGIMCNPYSSSASLMLECEVQVLASVGSSRVEIQWFFNDTTSQEILHITDTDSFPPLSAISYLGNQTVVDGDMWTLSSRITFSSLSSLIHQGVYFCQVALDGNIALFSPSDGLLVETEEIGEYLNFHPCSDALFKHTMKCAGNLSSSTSLTTSVPTSAASPLHTTSTAPPLRTTSAASLQHTEASSPSTADSSRGTPTLSLWVYVLVAIAAVFGMIIVVLTILCVGLCLKKNKTTDSFKQNTPELRQFTTNAMVTNGLYHKEDEAAMSGTHCSSHSQISDYNTLGERDYEIIDVKDDCKKDYNHLLRPSPPLHPSGRNGTFVFASSKEFHSMSTLSSQLGSKVNKGSISQTAGPSGAALQQGVVGQPENVDFPPKSASVGPEDHIYRELESALGYDSPRRTASHSSAAANAPNMSGIYHSPTDQAPPDSAHLEQRAFMFQGVDAIDEGNSHEALYFPLLPTTPTSGGALCNGIQPGGLENKPETGHVFLEPMNPTAFPVHKYEKISTNPDYEVPIISRNSTTPTGHTSAINRPRLTNVCGGAHYEMEFNQNLKDNTNLFNQCRRNSEDQNTKVDGLLSPNSETSFSNLGHASVCNGGDVSVADVNLDTEAEGDLMFAGSPTNPGSNTDMLFSSTAFDNPTSVSAMGSYLRDAPEFDTYPPVCSTYGPQSVSSSASDSVSSCLNRLLQQDGEGVEPVGDTFLDEFITPMRVGELQPESISASLNNRDRDVQMEMQRKAWIEERRPHDSCLPSAYVFSGQPGQWASMETTPPKMCREIQTNRVELALPEYRRLKTIV